MYIPDIYGHWCAVLLHIGIPHQVKVLEAQRGGLHDTPDGNLRRWVASFDQTIKMMIGSCIDLWRQVILVDSPVLLIANQPCSPRIGVNSGIERACDRLESEPVTHLRQSHHLEILSASWLLRGYRGTPIQVPTHVQTRHVIERHTPPNCHAEAARGIVIWLRTSGRDWG